MADGASIVAQERAPYEMASAATLAEQPLDTAKQPKPLASWTTVFSHLEARLGMLRTFRYSWWTYWNQLAEYIMPRRFKWLIIANKFDRGFPINQAIIDGKPTQDMQICAAGLLSGLMSPSRPWFVLGVGLPGFEPDADTQAWLEDTQERILTVMAQSNFYQTMAQAFQDVTVFGTAPVIIYEDFEDVIRAYGPCAGEYYLAAGARLSNDVLYREFTYTVSEIVEFFGLANCPQQIRTHWQTGGASLELEFVVAHSIEPNFPLSDRSGGKAKVVNGPFTFREIYWLKGMKTEAPLSVRGFTEKPFMVARWYLVSNDAYGRSPAMDALGDIKQLQQEQRRKAEFIEKLIRPPMGANPELKNEPTSIMPAHITYTSAKEGFWPLFQVNPAALPPMIQDIKDIEDRIASFFFVDVFMIISQMEGVQPRNELEITKREGEKIQRLGPMIENFETDVAAPAVQRVMSILERRRLLKPKPASMRGLPLKIEYISMIKLAQLAAETASMEQGMKIAGEFGAAAQEAGEPNPLRIIDLDEAMRTYLQRIRFPQKAVFSPDRVAAKDKAMAKQAQMAQNAKAMQAAAQVASQVGSIPVGQGQTALGALIGAQRGQPGAQP